MIVVRAPLRVSFVGGGTDYPDFFEHETGFVLGTTINKYVYVSALSLPNFAEEEFRFTYRVTESVQKVSEFKHPVMRASLTEKKWKLPINIATMSDLPGRSGLGSSSSFTVALECALGEFVGQPSPPLEIAQKAIRIEREILGEKGGYQDQYQAAVGGFNLYEFKQKSVTAHPIKLSTSDQKYLSNSLVLVPMKNWRNSNEFASITAASMSSSELFTTYERLARTAKETHDMLIAEDTIENKFQHLSMVVANAWTEKVKLAKGTIEKPVLDVIELGLKLGASAGRLCGAGGTGFVLFMVKPDLREDFVEELGQLDAFSIEIENLGCLKIPNSLE